MPELVALDLPAGPAFVDALRAVWDTGDAVAPLDQRLPHKAKADAMAVLRPTKVVDPSGTITTLPEGQPVEEGDALVMATSGSSGRAKGVVLTHDALLASALATSSRLGVDPLRHSWLACLPLAHIGGLSVVIRALLTETPLTVLHAFEADEVIQIGRLGRATHVSLVATALRRVDPSLFVKVLLGGAAPPSERADNVVATYGMTETGSGVVYDGAPLQGVELSIGSGLAGEGQLGEILIRAPMLLRCYRDGSSPRLNGPDQSGGWFPTGDGGRLTASGELEVDGRLAEVIVTGGEKVWPNEVERVLLVHGGVAEVAVWKRPDDEWGERVVAWVVPSPTGPSPLLEELRQFVGNELAPWAAPKEVVLVSSLPRTPSGKVRRSDLA
jgi:o-succinylbenzoate---CoA ligase